MRWQHGTQDVHFRQSWASCLQQFPPIPSGLLTWVPCHFFSDPGPRNDQCPRMNLRAYSVTLCAFTIHCSLFPRFLQWMSFHIDMKTVLPWKCSDSHFNSVIIFWISSRICNVVLGTFYTRIQFVLRRFDPDLWEKCDSVNHLILLSHAFSGSGLVPPTHSTGSEKTQGFFFGCKLNSLVTQQGRLSPHELLPINRSNTSNFSLVSDQLPSHLEQLSQWFLGLIPGGTHILRIVCPWMNCNSKSDRHEYTPGSCVRNKVFHFCLWDHIFVSQSREPSPCAARSL